MSAIDAPGDIDVMLHFDGPSDDQRQLSGTSQGRVHLVVVGGDLCDEPMVRWCREKTLAEHGAQTVRIWACC